MGLSTKESDLGAAEHEASRETAGRGSLARDTGAALAAIKRELAALLVVACAGAPPVMLALDPVPAAVVLGGYGVGAGLWVHVRARGVLFALSRRGGSADES